jgi:hypothetical protein
MNAVFDEHLITHMTDEATLESALAHCGWEQVDRARWRRPSRNGDCVLEELAHRDRWRQFQLSGGAVPQLDCSQALEDNYCLFGPAKLIARTGNSPICRVDVPDELGEGNEHAFGADGRLQLVNAYGLWATAVTAFATGDGEMHQADIVVDNNLVDELKQAGWTASLDGGQFQVHIQRPGIYRQVLVERHASAGVKLATELIPLADNNEDCVGAIRHLANAINARLPLVRLAISKSDGAIGIRAEVGFGATLIPGTFLLLSLHALELAVALCVRELEALRDPALARVLLAVVAARELNV